MTVQRAGTAVHATRRDVAERAGVSATTVSNVLHSRAGVSPETRRLVLRAVESTGYRMPFPTPVRVLPILFITSTWTPYSATILAGAVEAAASWGTEVAVRSVGGASTGEWLDASEFEYAGIIAVTLRADAEEFERAGQRSLPVVLIDPEEVDTPRVTTITSNNRASARRAVDQLLDLGHERVGVLGGSERSHTNFERIEGCRSALRGRGLELPDSHVASGSFSFDHGYWGAKALLSTTPRPTALFALADILAAGVLRALHEAGLSVPDDISLVSFDDTMLARQLGPSLSTVVQPLREMGREAVERLLTASNRSHLAGPAVRFDTGFIHRMSTSAPISAPSIITGEE